MIKAKGKINQYYQLEHLVFNKLGSHILSKLCSELDINLSLAKDPEPHLFQSTSFPLFFLDSLLAYFVFNLKTQTRHIHKQVTS